MYSDDELLLFSILNTYNKIISPTLIHKIFVLSKNYDKNIFLLEKSEINNFLNENSDFKEEQIEMLTKIFSYDITQKILEKAEEINEICDKKNINIISLNNPLYPKNLKKIKFAPYLLYVKGNLPNEEILSKSLAIVGTRSPSKIAEDFTKKIGNYLNENNYFNVSGLANGIDTIGHISMIKNTGAILGQGLNTKIYPYDNKYLAEEILNRGGFLASELPPDENISTIHLINRNRIQSGFVNSIFIGETGIKGGTIHTFKYARSQNKNIFSSFVSEEFNKKYSKNLIVINNLDEFKIKIENLFKQEELF